MVREATALQLVQMQGVHHVRLVTAATADVRSLTTSIHDVTATAAEAALQAVPEARMQAVQQDKHLPTGDGSPSTETHNVVHGARAAYVLRQAAHV